MHTTSRPPTVKRVTIPIRELPTSLNGLRVALLTDVHIGPTVGKARMSTIVDVVNGETPGASISPPINPPDEVFISGDLTDGHVEHLGGALSPLDRLSPPLGTYFATGNHEYYHGRVHAWIERLETHKVGTYVMARTCR